MKATGLILVSLMVILAGNVSGIENPEMRIVLLGELKAKVLVTREKSEIAETSILDGNGDIIYHKKSKTAMRGYDEVFNFSNLEDGNYSIKMEVGKTTFYNPFSITEGKIVLKKQEKECEPFLSYSDKVLKASYLNFAYKDITVFVYDNHKLLYSSDLGNDLAIHFALDFSKLDKGNYDVLLANEKEEYWFSINQ